MPAADRPTAHRAIGTAREHAAAVEQQRVHGPRMAGERGATGRGLEAEDSVGCIPHAHAAVVGAAPDAHPKHEHRTHRAGVAMVLSAQLASVAPHDNREVGAARDDEVALAPRLTRRPLGGGEAVDAAVVAARLHSHGCRRVLRGLQARAREVAGVCSGVAGAPRRRPRARSHRGAGSRPARCHTRLAGAAGAGTRRGGADRP